MGESGDNVLRLGLGSASSDEIEKNGKDAARREASAARESKKRALARAEAVLAAQSEAALWFKALGDPTRLRIYDLLREHHFAQESTTLESAEEDAPAALVENAGEKDKNKSAKLGKPAKAAELETEDTPGGLTVGAVAEGLYGPSAHKNAASTVSHHLKELRHAGLISMKRQGKNIVCRMEEKAAARLAGYLCDMPPTLKIK